MSGTGEPGPGQEAEREARISDLAAGFALGELTDAELRELYDTLREPGERGVRAARLAWHQLGMVTDLRAQLGATFQESIRHRVAKEGLSDRFVRNARSRLGLASPNLAELSEPRPAPRVRRGLLLLAGVLAGFSVVAVVLALHAHASRLCLVRGVAGGATLGGEALLPGSPVDGRQVVVPAGSEIELAWSSARTGVVISGPANVIAQPTGISVANGQAWVTSEGGFTIGLPDGTVHAAEHGHGQLALDVADGRSVLGAAAGEFTTSAGPLGSGEALAGSETFPWLSCSLAQLPERTVAAPDWSCEARAQWKDAGDVIVLVVANAERSHGWSILWRPGAVQVGALGVAGAGRTVPLAGPPLSEVSLEFAVRGGRLRLRCAGDTIVDEALAGRSSLELPAGARGPLAELGWHSGPPAHPPLALQAPADP